MRILSIGLLYPPHSLGGYELVCESVMDMARARGHDVRVLASTLRLPGVSEEDPEYVRRVLRAYVDPSARHALALSPAQRLRLERANAAELERQLDEFRPDVVSWWAMGGMSLSLIERVRRRGLPSVLAVHDDWLIYGPLSDSWTRMTRRLLALAPLLEPPCGVPIRYRLADAGTFVFNSRAMQTLARDAGIDPPRSTVITPGIQARFLQPARSEQWRGRMLYAGRVDRTKGVDLAVAALARLAPEMTLRIVGGGDQRYAEELLGQARSLGVAERVELVGAVAPEQLPRVYADADVVVFPVRWEEPWGLVPLEAMGVGRPVVATALGGAVDYLRDERNALLIASEDVAALAGAVERLAADPALRERLREGGRLTARANTAERHDRRVVEALERAAGSASVAPSSARRQASVSGADV